MKSRIWELDAFRGLCILGVIAVHLVYDSVELFGLFQWDYPPAFSFISNWGSVLFLLLSGICVTLGSRCVRRGITIFLCGMVCSLVTFLMYRFGFAGKEILIYFGVLHCLGCCMILWPLFRRLPVWTLAVLGMLLAAAPLFLLSVKTEQLWLIPLGICPAGFVTSDYFPLLPNLGFFLLGAVLGKTLYRSRKSLLPDFPANILPVRFLRFCGRQSLWIYLLHQPILAAILSWVSACRP